MKPLVLFASLIALALGGCSWIPKAGPSTSEVVEKGQRGSEILYDVVRVDDRVVSTLLAQPKEIRERNGWPSRARQGAERPVTEPGASAV